MIVEDERVIAFHLKSQLLALGYQVCAMAARGEDALRKAHQFHPDLVLMDINLEGSMDGTEAAQRILAQLRIPVVFLTAYAEEETLRRAQTSEPFGYLVKPCQPRELHATLQMALTRRAAEASVERSEERLLFALDAAGLGVWEWDEKSGQFTASGSIDALFWGVSEALAESLEAFLARVHPEDSAVITSALNEALAQDRAVNLVFRCQRPSSAVGWIEAHAKAYRATPSASARVVGVLKDITDRRQTEERLRQAGVILETTAEGIFIMDRDRHIVSVNPAFIAITGYRAEQVLGCDPDVLLHVRRHSDQFYPRLESTAEGRWQGDIDCRNSKGEVFPAWENVSVVRDAAGRVTHYVVAFSDISALRRVEEKFNQLAHYDPLTGLPNRLLFDDRLDQALKYTRRVGQRCALLFVDLDGFKVINDTLGHASGDLLLQTVAARIKGVVRRSDTAARLGGDEFVIVANIAHPEDGARLAHKLIEVLGAPIDLGSERIVMSASVGVAVYPNDGGDRHALLKAADTAMYAAKAQGRNRYCFYTQEMALRAAERMRIEQGLRRAIDTHGLILHYQPQVRLRDGAITGMEALVRWQHPEQGLIGPDRFIAIAEESGVIEPLGRWVLFTACREAARWDEAGGPPLRLAVNISARQIARDHLEDTVRAALAESGFPAARLEIEITESTLQVVENSRQFLDALKTLGVSIAIDDFGTGYSSLSILKDLPIDRLKVDRAFVRDIPGDGNDLAIVEAISALSRTLKLDVTAEGVETEAQLDALRRLDCEEGQGYLFSRPVPLPELRRLVAEGNPWASRLWG
jgi:diguanylate cyclase (GGDEF)-like protein/PAS domain S-box-containing protein